jgi:hypothetical protein
MKTSKEITDYIVLAIAQGVSSTTTDADSLPITKNFEVMYETKEFAVIIGVQNRPETDSFDEEYFDQEVELLEITDEDGNEFIGWLNEDQKAQILDTAYAHLPKEAIAEWSI